MDNKRLDEWVRHYSNLFWTVTSIFLAANGALFVYCSDKNNFKWWLGIGGLLLTGVTVFFAASMRELRHHVQEHLDKELLSIIQQGRRLWQWWAFIFLFLAITVGWTWVLCAHAPTWWLLWLILGIVFGIATFLLGLFFADAGKKNKSPEV